MQNRQNIFLLGNSIFLRPLIENDLNGNYQFWLNDKEVIEHNSHGRFPLTKEKLNEYYRSINQSNSLIVLAIVFKETNEHIGNISLQNINWVDRNAEIAFLLGEKAFWGKSIMLEAGKILLQHAFKTLNLHRVYCATSSSNMGMQKLALKLGMSQEGVREEAIFNNGIFHNIIEYGILSTNEIL